MRGDGYCRRYSVFTEALIGEIVIEYESMDDKVEPSGVAITEHDMYKIGHVDLGESVAEPHMIGNANL